MKVNCLWGQCVLCYLGLLEKHSCVSFFRMQTCFLREDDPKRENNAAQLYIHNNRLSRQAGSLLKVKMVVSSFLAQLQRKCCI
jgi:hypothetical protein